MRMMDSINKFLLSACSATQSQIEGASAVILSGTGPKHIHNVEGFGDLTHQHPGNSQLLMVIHEKKFNVIYKSKSNNKILNPTSNFSLVGFNEKLVIELKCYFSDIKLLSAKF